MFAFLYHIAAPLVWTFVVLCFLVSILLMFIPFPWQNAPQNKNWYLLLGFLCFAATLLATTAGYWNVQQHLEPFWSYEGARSYTNVIPTESALSHLDAGKMIFSVDAKVDVSKAAGYRDGTWYCVAPIVVGQNQEEIEFWAVGTNCCSQSGTFTCGDIDDSEAHSGLVQLYGSLLDPDDHKKYLKAVEGANAASGLTSSADALFVTWVSDAEAAQEAYYNTAIGFMCVSAAIHLLFSSIVGFVVHFGSRPDQKKTGMGSRSSAYN